MVKAEAEVYKHEAEISCCEVKAAKTEAEAKLAITIMIKVIITYNIIQLLFTV